MDMTQFRFAHHKLLAYQVASEMADLVRPLAEQFGRGHRELADQLRRSADGTVALVGEGANRYLPKQKRQPRGAGCPRRKSIEARGEAGEVACHIERAFKYGLVSEQEALAVLKRADSPGVRGVPAARSARCSLTQGGARQLASPTSRAGAS